MDERHTLPVTVLVLFPNAAPRSSPQFSPHLTLEKELRLPIANDLASQKTEAPPLPVIILLPLPEPGKAVKSPIEIRRMSTPSPELLETVTPPPRWRLVPCSTKMPAP